MSWKKIARWSGMLVVFSIVGTIDIIAICKVPPTEIIAAAKDLGGKYALIATAIVTFYYKLESEKEV